MERPRALILALDGATLDLIGPWAKQGRLPHLAGLLERGGHGPLRSTTPPITPCAWTSFYTGMGPGRHGVYDFNHVRPGTYELVGTDATFRRTRTLWDYLGDCGLTVGLHNLPWMFPPQPLPGYIICGFGGPAVSRRSVHPPDLADELRAAFPDLSLVVDFIKRTEGGYDLDRLRRQVELSVEVAEYLLTRHPVDVSVLGFMFLDQVAHFFLHPDAGRRGWGDVPDVVEQVHKWLDEGIGRLLTLVPDDAVIMAASDHGVQPIRLKLNLDRALMDAGLLVLHQDAPSDVSAVALAPAQGWGALASRIAATIVPAQLLRKVRMARNRARLRRASATVDWSRTRAYTFGNFAWVRLNLRGREPQGVVAPQQREEVLSEVRAALLGLTDPNTGERLFADVRTLGELYSGPYADGVGDVLGIPVDWGVEVSVHIPLPEAPLFVDDATAYKVSPGMGLRVASHAMEGLFLATGPMFRKGVQLGTVSILDVVPTLVHALGLPLPQDLDGKPIPETFTSDFLAEHPVQYSAAGLGAAPPSEGPAYSEDEAAEVEQRLKDLGYM